jgi:hypothetical protein
MLTQALCTVYDTKSMTNTQYICTKPFRATSFYHCEEGVIFPTMPYGRLGDGFRLEEHQPSP